MKGIDNNIRKVPKILFSVLFSIIIFAIFAECGMIFIYASERTKDVTGDYYEFEEKSHYEYSSTDSSNKAVLELNTSGTLSIIGDFDEDTGANNLPVYTIKDGNLSISYDFNSSSIEVEEAEWHLVDDKSKKVDDLVLEDNVMQGALIIQSSLDGETWLEDVIITDIFSEETILEDILYVTKDIQQQNGCYYRLVVVYSLERNVGDKKVAFIKVDDIEKKKVAEVYEFYVVDKEISDATSASDLPKKELGKKVNTGKDTGYFDGNVVNLDDPHYGWDIGTFFVNGYTREGSDDDGNSIFLKNIGDKVTLWLEQDLLALDGDDRLVIAEDTNGYDKEFEVGQTNFGLGTLIMSYTDYQGITYDPVIYTNYIAANTRTGADTRVQLFEEGDYEVTLDYEIKNSPLKLGELSVLPSYSNYKVRFSFSIRNGNCMVYPFDSITGAELSERAVTESGFRLDMAKSRYLTIDVTKSVLKEAGDGTIVEDIRFNGPAKDGETYTDEGIYSFTVKNLYTGGEPTTKTIFVGNNKYNKAISGSGYTLVELNEKILKGSTIAEDGSIMEPVEVITETIENKVVEDKTVTKVEVDKQEGISDTEENINQLENLEVEKGKWNLSSISFIPIGISIVAFIAIMTLLIKRKSV